MKVLVLSDSHCALSFMRDCITAVKPDAVVHLGDHYEDGEVMKEEFPGIPFYQVPGNCDRYRGLYNIPEILITKISGVPVYMTHGHRHNVKMTVGLLLRDARASGAAAVLYGHTHIRDCYREEDGLWVLNPGSCGYCGGSAGLMEIRDQKIVNCRILTDEDIALMPL